MSFSTSLTHFQGFDPRLAWCTYGMRRPQRREVSKNVLLAHPASAVVLMDGFAARLRAPPLTSLFGFYDLAFPFSRELLRL